MGLRTRKATIITKENRTRHTKQSTTRSERNERNIRRSRNKRREKTTQTYTHMVGAGTRVRNWHTHWCKRWTRRTQNELCECEFLRTKLWQNNRSMRRRREVKTKQSEAKKMWPQQKPYTKKKLKIETESRTLKSQISNPSIACKSVGWVLQALETFRRFEVCNARVAHALLKLTGYCVLAAVAGTKRTPPPPPTRCRRAYHTLFKPSEWNAYARRSCVAHRKLRQRRI